MKTPDRTTAAAFPRYTTGQGLADSASLQWPGLYVRRARFPRVVDRVLVPATLMPLLSMPRPSDKLGFPLAGDDVEAVQVAAQLVRDAGCEPVVVGNLAAATSFQRGGPGFRANTTAPNLRRLLGLPEGK